MPETNFRAAERLRDFRTRIKSSGLNSIAGLYFLGWLASLIFILYAADSVFTAIGLVQIVHLFCWYKLTLDINQKFRPSAEVLIVTIFLTFLIEGTLLRAAYSNASVLPGFLATTFQVILLSSLILSLTLILIQNTHPSAWFFVLAFLLVVILLNLVDNQGLFYYLLVQIILFIVLLRRTAWLEVLTKTECWLYLIIFIFAFGAFSDGNPFAAAPDNFYKETIWFQMPKLLYLGFKMYLLAVLLKIPVVLVYNFASLSRKLKISSLFQSTVPQLIQLIMLSLIFFFFIAGWQAEKVRVAVTATIKEINAGKLATASLAIKVPSEEAEKILSLPGYPPFPLSYKLPDQGVLAVPASPAFANGDTASTDYFIFYESREEDRRRFFHFVKLDSTFLKTVTNRTSILAGSLLLAHSYQPPRWESYLYELSFLRDDRRFWIFPFAVMQPAPAWSVSYPMIRDNESTHEWQKKLDNGILNRLRINVGRVVAPLVDHTKDRSRFFAFDILLIPDTSLFSATLLSYIVFLMVVYMVVNAVVVGRMTKFGEEINQMIVQKFTQLKNGIREISSGNLDYKVKIEGRDEFVEVGERFNTMSEKLKESIEEAREKERLEHELAIARQVQRDLLPRTLPNIPGFQVAATLKTANEVGGDFYDLLPLDDQRFLFTIGDVSGKGTSAAFYMAQCISLIRFSPQFSRDPREIVLRINKYFSDPLIDRQVFVTAVVGLLDSKASKLQLVRAGHNPPIFIPGNTAKGVAELNCDGLGIGIERNGGLFDEKLELVSLKFQPGDTLVFYTDGFVEAASAADETAAAFYSEERLHAVLKNARGARADELLRILNDDIEQFYSGRPLVDDYTLLIIQKEV